MNSKRSVLRLLHLLGDFKLREHVNQSIATVFNIDFVGIQESSGCRQTLSGMFVCHRLYTTQAFPNVFSVLMLAVSNMVKCSLNFPLLMIAALQAEHYWIDCYNASGNFHA